MEHKTIEEINIFRREIEADIAKLIKETGSDFSLDDVRQVIHEEEDNDDMQKVIAMFDNGDLSNLSNVLELVTDAWNYFPHKSLNGMSPAEKAFEYTSKNIIKM